MTDIRVTQAYGEVLYSVDGVACRVTQVWAEVLHEVVVEVAEFTTAMTSTPSMTAGLLVAKELQASAICDSELSAMLTMQASFSCSMEIVATIAGNIFKIVELSSDFYSTASMQGSMLEIPTFNCKFNCTASLVGKHRAEGPKVSNEYYIDEKQARINQRRRGR